MGFLCLKNIQKKSVAKQGLKWLQFCKDIVRANLLVFTRKHRREYFREILSCQLFSIKFVALWEMSLVFVNKNDDF